MLLTRFLCGPVASQLAVMPLHSNAAKLLLHSPAHSPKFKGVTGRGMVI